MRAFAVTDTVLAPGSLPRNQYPLMSRDQMSQPQKIHLWGGQEELKTES